MNKNKIVILIFLLTLIFRLYFVFTTPYFADDNAYYNMRQIDNILENNKPIFEDDLSYSGKEQLFSPVFYYFMSAFVFIFGDVALKVLPEILISSLVIIVYLIIKSITNDDKAILFSSFIAGFIPILITNTLNNISVYALALPLTFLTLLAFIRLENKRYLNLFIILSVLLPLVHPIAFLLSLSFILYLLISKSEDVKIMNLNKEAIFFFVFVTLFIEFLIYRNAFLTQGFNAVWQNIPDKILDRYFINVNLGKILLGLGIMPLLFALIGVYFGIFRQRNNVMVLFSSMLLGILLILSFKLINFEIGVLFLAITVTILSSVGFEKFFKYIEITKMANIKNYIMMLLFLIVVLTLVLPAYVNAQNVIRNGFNDDEFSALKWIKENTEQDAVIFSSIDEGNFVTAVSNRKNVMDENFLLVKNINEKYNDVEEFFTTTSIAKSVNIMSKYNSDYVYISDRTKKIYNRESFSNLEDKTCFRESYNGNGEKIYKRRC